MHIQHQALHGALAARAPHHTVLGNFGVGNPGSGGGVFGGSSSGPSFGEGSGGDGSGDGGDGGDGGDDGGNTGTATLVSIVFVTDKPTFTGSIEGFSTALGTAATQGGDAQPTAVAPVPVPVTHHTVPVHTVNPQPTPSREQPTSSAVVTSAQQLTSQAEPTVPSSITNANGAVASASASPSSSANASSSASNQGLSSGAKAGVAIGVLLGLAALAGLALVLIRQMKKRREEREDEKHNPFGDSAAAVPPRVTRGFTPPPVPPMSDFPRPSTSGSNAAAFNARPAPSVRSATIPEPPVNPFGEHAAIGSQTSFNGSIPIHHDDMRLQNVSPMSSDPEKEIIGAAFGGAAVGAAAAAVPSHAYERHPEAPAPLELDGSSRPMPPFAAPPVPASPSPSQYSFTSVAPSAVGLAATGAAGAAAGVAAAAPSNVHRVQLDFHPSMHDEMELRAGEMVRMLHEYDDGWALCVKFDKSARGVCPRTCLSQKPLQPRNRAGSRPTAPAMRPPPAGPFAGPPSRTASPAPPAGFSNSRSASPAPSQIAPMNANLGNWPAKPVNNPHMGNWPAQPVNAPQDMVKRSMSPGPYGGGPQAAAPPRSMGPMKRRSQSVGNVPAMTPPRSITSGEFQLPIQGGSSTSPLPRKPVPGVAA